ncbi:PEP-utilizing enzyme [Nocardia higoensis]|uniref:PEP-utilizing enzyme n=1 Tax=Nocardia higoensis TaxID=228599 RepID=UPI000307C4D1|nr:PEP-utilizing enzyme [Nocardia higoensis]
MADPSATVPKWGAGETLPLPSRYNRAVRELVARRAAELELNWATDVFTRSAELFSAEDARAIEQEVLDSGYRFEFSATASLDAEPEKYRKLEAGSKTFVVDDDGADEGLRGRGDNVIATAENTVGTVLRISRIEHVMQLLTDGVPPGTIAVIDDSGGTLTAPILEGFHGVICLGGTVRSHLGILAREYNVPTLMNCRIEGLEDGDRVELETTAAPPAADAYETGDTGHARIWKLQS